MCESELVGHLLENYYTDDPRKGLSVISLSIKLEGSAIFGLAHNNHMCAKAYDGLLLYRGTYLLTRQGNTKLTSEIYSTLVTLEILPLKPYND